MACQFHKPRGMISCFFSLPAAAGSCDGKNTVGYSPANRQMLSMVSLAVMHTDAVYGTA